MPESEPTPLVDKEAYAFAAIERRFGPTGPDSYVGVVVPTGGTLIYPDPHNPPRINAGMVENFQVMDNQHLDYRDSLPNFWVMEWITLNEPDGIFYGWRFSNRDELMRRWVKALFKWRGPGPYIAQTMAATGQNYWQASVAFAAGNVRSADWGVCHADGVNYNWSHGFGDNNTFSAHWTAQGLQVDGIRPGFKIWTLDGMNNHPRDARFIRVVVNAD